MQVILPFLPCPPYFSQVEHQTPFLQAAQTIWSTNRSSVALEIDGTIVRFRPQSLVST